MLDATFGSGLEVICIGMRYELACFVVSLYFMPDDRRGKSTYFTLNSHSLKQGFYTLKDL